MGDPFDLSQELAKSIFLDALEIASLEARAAFIDGRCGGDEQLRADVATLLRNHEHLGDYLERSACDPEPTQELPHRRQTEGPGTVIGPYKLLEQIGEGGFGVVYMAEQQKPVRRKVALKILKPGMDSRQVVARFEAERQALALMDHPNIAHVFDGGETASGRPYFVMELVRGIPFTVFCDQNHLPIQNRLELFVDVCLAVQHAHQKGVIHRDIKPSNVLVTLHDDTPVVKVIDFGIAKATGQQLTEKTLFTSFAQMIGTPLYMSPEQAQMSGLDVDTRTDIYSLGVLLYELLTGTTPFDKERLKTAAYDEIRRIIREEEPARPSTRISTLGEAASTVSANRKTDAKRLGQLFRGELDWIAMKAIEKDRNRRYESASAFAADVRRYLNDEAVMACPPSRRYRLGKMLRRHRAALATTTLLILAVLVTAAGLAVSNARISGESRQKVKALGAARASEREAVESLKDALAAVDQMLTRVSEERLQDLPQFEPVRRQLLEDALHFYERFLARRGDNPAIRREAALARRRMASLHFQLGDYRSAEQGYRQAFAELDQLDRKSPLDRDARRELVSAYVGFSWVLRNQGKYEEGEGALRRAVATAGKLVHDFPDVASYREQLCDVSDRLAGVITTTNPAEAGSILRRNLALTEHTNLFWDRARTYRNLGILQTQQHDRAGAEAAYRNAVSLYEKALAASPHLNWLLVELAGTLKELSRVVDECGRPQEAEPICQRAIPMFDRFAADFPAGPHNRWGQAGIHFQHALLLDKLRRSADAEQEYRRTVELFDRLVGDFPALPGYMATAVHRHHALAQFLAEAGRPAEAEQAYDGAATLLQKLSAPQQAQALRMRAHFYAGLGQWPKATADLTEAIRLSGDESLQDGCALALLHLGAGRPHEYSAVCAGLMDRFGSTDSPWLVATCVLAPGALSNPSRLVHMARRLLDRDPKNANYLAILGCALYREGNVRDATEKLEASLSPGHGLLGSHAPNLVLAMAYLQSGRRAAGEQLLHDVREAMKTESARKGKRGADPAPPLAWAYKLGLQLLLREAEEMLTEDACGRNRG